MPQQNTGLLRSDSLREFISYRPGVLIRWGIPVFFLILAGLALGSYFIQYPDIVSAKAKVNSVNPPKPIITKTGGRLIKLFKGDNWDVKQGDIIGYMESTANHNEVLQLSVMLDTLQLFTEANSLEEIPGFWKASKKSFSHLGELQQAHQSFMQAYISFKDYLNTGFYVTKKQMLARDLLNAKKLFETLLQQKKLQLQGLAITQKNFDVHDTLHDEALINNFEFRNQQSQLINKKMGVPQMNAAIINNQNQQNALQKEMLEMDNQVVQQRAVFVQAFNAYKNMVEEWKQKYLLTAPVNGKFENAGFLAENQQLQTGQILGYVTNKSNKYFVEMLVPQTNFGKVKPEQEVLLKFPAYPSQEFGSVKGRIEYIKNIPSDSGYLARVILPDGLVTNYKKPLLYSEGMVAISEIITEKKRLSDRFLSGIRNLLK